MTAHLTHLLERAFSFVGFLFAISTFTLFLSAVPVLLLALFWLQ